MYVCVCVSVCVRSHRVDARQLSQSLRKLLQLAEAPASLPLLPVDLPQQEVPTQTAPPASEVLNAATRWPEKHTSRQLRGIPGHGSQTCGATKVRPHIGRSGNVFTKLGH